LAPRNRAEELNAWVLATAPRAVAYAQSLLHNLHQSEDIVQDCYCRLLQKADVYDLPKDGLKILLTAITNAAINLKTRQKPTIRLHRTDEEDDLDPPDRTISSPEELAMGNELERFLAQALNELPDLQRAAIELKSIGYSQTEIAEILNVSVSHAGVLIHRARQALAQNLAPYLGEEKVK
jgi:RNA polymerase sigma factor (sigma-70 family)